MVDLTKKEKRSLREYTFSPPEPEEGGMLKVSATHAGQTVGTLTIAAKPMVRPNHSYDGYHEIGRADVHAYHRGNGVYGKMLQVAAQHVKKMGSRGLVSPGEWREDKATKAWERLASKIPAVKKRPGQEPENPDFFLSEEENVEPLGSESSPDNIEHEWFVEFMRWLANRQDLNKSVDLSNLLDRNLSNAHHTRADEEIAVLMSGASHHHSPEFKAAKFLANGKNVSEDQIRNSLVLYDHDFELAALHAYGLPRNKQFVEMLRATMKMGSPELELSKADIEVAALPRHFEAVLPDGKEVAAALQRAQSAGTVKAVKLGGKHSKGTAIAVDPKTNKRWLMKPGSGQLSPARGVRQEKASQSRREVAFYKLAELGGVQDAFPGAYLMNVDGVEVAVMELLDTDYQSLDKAKRKMRVDPRPLFEPHRKDGSLYKWAALDWILGNADRHANNIMVKDKKLKLIDHGTTFAGSDFDPALDLNKSFIPYYLRAWSRFNFTALEPRDRAAQMPTMDQRKVHEFGQWVEELPEEKFQQIMELYGINPEPSLARLRDLKSAKPEQRAQRLIGLWAGTLRPQSPA